MTELAYGYTQPVKRLSLRKLLLILGSLVIIVVVAVQLFDYFTLGRLVVRAKNNTTISIGLASTQATVSRGVGNLSVRLHPGQYVVTVSGQSASSSQVVSVTARKTHTVYLSINKTVAVEPVSDTTATNIVASGSNVYFLNGSGNLSSIDSNNNQTVLNTGVSFKNIAWANSTFGVGQDTTGHLYLIKNGAIQALQTPPVSSASVFAVAPDQTIYLAEGASVYSDRGGAFNKVYIAASDITLLSASNEGVLAVSGPDKEGRQTATDTNQQTGTAFISTSGKVTKKGFGTFTAAISPRGLYIALSSSGGGQVLDARLNKIATIPSANFSNPKWLSDKTLIYSLGDQLWSYDISLQKSQLIANAPSGGLINELSVSDDGAHVYMGVNHINNTPVLKRVSLTGAPASSLALQLQSIMPYTASNYFMSLVNFTKTTILVTPLPPLTDTNDQYLQEAASQLSSMGIDTSTLDIRLSH